jgi:hypothetical protein
MASQVSLVHTLAHIWQPIHSSNRICTGGMGIPYFSMGTVSMQSTGQKGTHTWHPVQLSSSTTAINFGFFIFLLIVSAGSGTDL